MEYEAAFPRVLYESERSADEMADKGYLSHSSVEFQDGTQYAIFVTDPEFLRQDIELDFKSNEGISGHVALIVVPQVTRATVEAAVKKLATQGYFKGLKPLKSWSAKGPVYEDY